MPLLRSHAPTGTMMNSLLAGKGGSSSARALDPCRTRARSSVYVYRSTVIYVQADLVRERHDGAAGATTSSPRHPFPAVFCTACLSPLSLRGKTIPLRGFDESPTSSLPSGSSTSFQSLDRIKTPSYLPSTSPLSHRCRLLWMSESPNPISQRMYYVQRSAKVGAPGWVNAAGKAGRSDKQQQEQTSPNLVHRL